MATMTQPRTPHRGMPRPSLWGIVAIFGIVAIVWAALAVQAAIIGDRQNTTNNELRQEIASVKAGAPASAEALPVQASDQAKAQAYDASLPPATANPVKDITLT